MATITHYAIGGNVVTTSLESETKLVVAEGDNLVFDVPSTQLLTLTKVGVHLNAEFANHEHLHVEHFFDSESASRESLLTFTDTLFTSSEIESCSEGGRIVTVQDLQKQEKGGVQHVLNSNGKMTGGSGFTARIDTLFTYQFCLADDIDEKADVSVRVNGHTLPKWLKLKNLGKKHYLLSGMPTEKDLGDFNLEIIVEI